LLDLAVFFPAGNQWSFDAYYYKGKQLLLVRRCKMNFHHAMQVQNATRMVKPSFCGKEGMISSLEEQIII
jgi:hypothetical protein